MKKYLIIRHTFFFTLILFSLAFTADAVSQDNSLEKGTAVSRQDINSENDPIIFRVFDIEGVSDEYKRKIVEGIRLSYVNSPDIEEPLAIFDSLTASRPDRPEGYFLKSVLFYILYSANPKTALSDSLRHYSYKAIELTEELMKDDPENKYYKFYLGAAYGNMGLYYLKNRSYWKAYRNGKKGKNYLEKALKADPDFGDAQFGIGIFYYYADVLTKYIKPLLFIIGMSGDSEKGLRLLEGSLKNSSLSQVEARDFLSRFYSRYEGRREEAEQYMLQLHKAFPDNPWYLYNLSVFYYESGNYLKSEEHFNRLLKKRKSEYRFYRRNSSFYLGLIYNKLGEYRKSNSYLDRVVNLYGTSAENMLRSTYFYIGKNLEYMGNRDQALAYYKKAKDEDSDSHKYELEYLIDHPVNEKDFILLETDRLLNNRKFEEAASKAENELNDPDKSENGKNVRIDDLLKLRSAEAHFRLDHFDRAKDIYGSINKKNVDDNESDAARYYVLGTEIFLSANDRDTAWEYLEEIYDMDRDGLPVYYVRRALYLQNKILGEIKKR